MARPNGEEAKKAIVADVMELTEAFKGQRFSITGHLGLSRPEVVKLIERAGGQFDKEPRWGTTYLITNQDWTARTAKPGSSKKLEAARAWGTKVITEQQFYDMLFERGKAPGDGAGTF